MGFFSISKSLCRLGIEFLVLALIITFLPGLPPGVDISKPYKVTKAAATGKYSLNNKLDAVEILHNNLIHGPESLVDDSNFIYTSLHLGNIVKIVGSHIIPLAKFGKPCKGVYQESICGRPLGITFGNDGYLYAVDTYYGIFRVDVKTGEKKQLVAPGQDIEGKKIRSPNDLTVACNGDIYWTDSSSDFLIQDTLFALLANPSGRLIRYNALVGTNEVLIDNMLYPNGVALSSNEDFLLISELGRSRIIRYHLKGSKKGQSDVFIDGLPGNPDNIRSIGKSGFLITLASESHSGHPNLIQTFSQFPNVRKFFARVLGLMELSFKTINGFYPNEICEKGVHFVGNAESASPLMGRSGVVHASENGEIMDVVWTSSNGRFSEAEIIKDHLYLGSAMNKYLSRIPLSKIGWGHLRKNSDFLTVKQQRCSEIYKDTSTKNVNLNEEPIKRETARKVASKPVTTTTTVKPSTYDTTTAKPVKTTSTPTTAETTTVKPTTVKPTTAKPTTVKTTTAKPTTAEQTTIKSTTMKPAVVKSITPKPNSESSGSKPNKVQGTQKPDVKPKRSEEMKDSPSVKPVSNEGIKDSPTVKPVSKHGQASDGRSPNSKASKIEL